MSRSGRYISQLRGYKAFIPTPLPPEPELQVDETLNKRNEKATITVARLDGLAYSLYLC